MKHVTLGLITAFFLVLISCSNNSKEKIFTGVLEGTSVRLPALTGGQIIKLMVDEGYSVLEGDTIAVIDTVEYHLHLRQFQAGLRELDIQEMIANIQYKQAKTDLEYIKDKYERTKVLFEKKTATKQTLDDLTNQLQRAETNLANARQSIQRAITGKEQLSAQMTLIQKKIRDAVVVASIPGIITTKYYEISEAVAPMSPLVEIINLNVMDVKIYISETMLPHVKYGQQVEIRVDGSENQFQGNISWISPEAEFTPKSILTEETRTSLVYAVNVKVANPDGVLKHGMPVEVIL
jgi:HlyD family secretion protein